MQTLLILLLLLLLLSNQKHLNFAETGKKGMFGLGIVTPKNIMGTLGAIVLLVGGNEVVKARQNRLQSSANLAAQDRAATALQAGARGLARRSESRRRAAQQNPLDVQIPVNEDGAVRMELNFLR